MGTSGVAMGGLLLDRGRTGPVTLAFERVDTSSASPSPGHQPRIGCRRADARAFADPVANQPGGAVAGVCADRSPHGHRLAAAGDFAAGKHLGRTARGATGVDPGPRVGPYSPARLSVEPGADGHRDAPVLPSGGLVGFPPDSPRARGLLRRSGGGRVPSGWRRPAALCPGLDET
jgi:hypothetical protein